MQTFNFFGVEIANLNLQRAQETIHSYDFSKSNYVCFPDAYVVSLCQENEKLKSILNNSLLTLPDGKPSALMGRKKGFLHIESISGYWLCKSLLETSLSHYFLGGTEDRLKKLVQCISDQHPNAYIKGFSSPRIVTDEEAASGTVFKEEFEEIIVLKPDLIWIGMSSPKQDYIMHHHLPLLKHGLMLGVGGVFDYLSGEVAKSPEWVKKIGLRWAWRLFKEPRRLWSKYLFVFKTLTWKYLIEYIKG